MSVSNATKIILAFRSGGICAFPKCRKHLTYDAKVGDDTSMGEEAHIFGEKSDVARYYASMTNEQRNSVDV